jgi:HEAT repeat protein
VLRDLAAEAKGRQRRVFRELAAERDAELEADPEFHRLLEMDSDRKMALIDRDPVELARVRQAIGVSGGKISRRVLEKALVDPNTEVRLAALQEISLTMDAVPIDLLAPVVAGDPSAEVRLEALEILAEDESVAAVAVVRTALNDPDDDVRTEAEDLLDEWAEENF